MSLSHSIKKIHFNMKWYSMKQSTKLTDRSKERLVSPLIIHVSLKKARVKRASEREIKTMAPREKHWTNHEFQALSHHLVLLSQMRTFGISLAPPSLFPSPIL